MNSTDKKSGGCLKCGFWMANGHYDGCPELEHSTDWQDRFNIWMKGHDNICHGIGSGVISYLKDFIQQEIDASYKRGYEKGKNENT